jgi:hypothetical protein
MSIAKKIAIIATTLIISWISGVTWSLVLLGALFFYTMVYKPSVEKKEIFMVSLWTYGVCLFIAILAVAVYFLFGGVV